MRDLSLHLLDILGNSVRAGARTAVTEVVADPENDRLTVVVRDDGRGMDAALLATVEDPFTTTRTTRPVGLGIPLFKEAAAAADGTFRIASAPGVGTTVEADFRIGHIDRLPLGDLGSTFAVLAGTGREMDFELLLACGDRSHRFSTAEVREVLGDVPLSEPDVAEWIAESIAEAVREVFGGALPEIPPT